MRTPLLLALTLAASVAAQDPDAKPAQAKKKAAPTVVEVGVEVPASLALADLEGKKQTFGDLRGKVVFVHFWSITCPWEELAEPKIAALEDAYRKKDVVVLAVNANQNEIGAVPDQAAFAAKKDADKPYARLRETLRKKKLAFKVMVDHGNVVSDALQARATPHCFVIDKKGVLRYAGALDSDGRTEEPETSYVRDAIDAVLAGAEVERPTSRPYGWMIKKGSPRRGGRSRRQ